MQIIGERQPLGLHLVSFYYSFDDSFDGNGRTRVVSSNPSDVFQLCMRFNISVYYL